MTCSHHAQFEEELPKHLSKDFFPEANVQHKLQALSVGREISVLGFGHVW